MKLYSLSEKLFIEKMGKLACKMKIAMKGLSIGALIKSIRTQLKMSQKTLAKRAGIPQATVSRIEQGQRDVNLSTLHKIFNALECDIVLAPLLHDSIDNILRKQAKKIAKKQVEYLKGTMNLEAQHPDLKFLEHLLKQEEEKLLQGSNYKLWEE